MSNTELSEFFSLVSKEKSDSLEKLKTKINNPESGLVNLFAQLEDAHKEITRVSEEDSDEKILTEEDQNKIEVFSNLITSFDSVKELPEEVKVVHEIELKELEDEEPEEIIPEEVVKTDNIISDIVDALDVMGAKTVIKEEIDQISALRRDFDNFRNLIQRDMSGAGSGEVRLEFLDDVQSSTAKVDGKVLQYSSSDSKWVGATISTTPAADDISAGDAAVSITTTSGNITIDAAANNTDIIFKGTDGGSDITILTLDGSEAGAATFNSTITTTGLTIGSTAVTSTADELNILDGVTSTAAELNAVDGITAVVGELNALDLGITAVGTAIASKAVILDSNKDYTGIRNLTATTHIGALTGNADTATALATARTIGGTSFDGTANIAVGLATLATTVTITDNESTNESNALIFTAGGDVDGGNLGLESDGTLTYNPSTGKVTATGFVGTLTGNVTGNTSGTAATVTTAAQTNITSVGTLTALQVDNININGNAITSTAGTDLTITPVGGQQIVLDGAIVIDAGVVTGATSITSTAFVGDITGDITGNADTATTLATARTIGGTSFDGSANIAVALATLATTVTVTDNEDTNENNVLVFVAGADADGGNVGLESDGHLIYNPSTGTLSVPNIVVSGTQTIADTVTMQAENAIVFEGASADEHETTLTIIDPTGDRTINLPNQSGTIPVLAAASATAITSTPAELNLLDGSSANSVVNSKAVIYGSSGEVAGTLSTAAQTTITSLGTLTTLTVDNIIINGTNIGHTSDTNAIAIASNGVVTFSQNPVFPDGGVDIADLDINGGTDINAALVDADLLIVDDGADGTNRKTTMARIKTYINAVDEATAIAIALG
jgi:hypothetical protein